MSTMLSTLNEPRSDQSVERKRNSDRDAAIVTRYVRGARIEHLARDYQLTSSRISQILRANQAERPSGARLSRQSAFFDAISRDHLKAVATARLQVAQGWAVDPYTRIRLAELCAALDRALPTEEEAR